jgi:hypothetical protein
MFHQFHTDGYAFYREDQVKNHYSSLGKAEMMRKLAKVPPKEVKNGIGIQRETDRKNKLYILFKKTGFSPQRHASCVDLSMANIIANWMALTKDSEWMASSGNKSTLEWEYNIMPAAFQPGDVGTYVSLSPSQDGPDLWTVTFFRTNGDSDETMTVYWGPAHPPTLARSRFRVISVASKTLLDTTYSAYRQTIVLKSEGEDTEVAISNPLVVTEAVRTGFAPLPVDFAPAAVDEPLPMAEGDGAEPFDPMSALPDMSTFPLTGPDADLMDEGEMQHLMDQIDDENDDNNLAQ